MRLICLMLVLSGGAGCTAAGRAAFLGERWRLPSLRPQHASEMESQEEESERIAEKEPLIAKLRTLQQHRLDPVNRALAPQATDGLSSRQRSAELADSSGDGNGARHDSGNRSPVIDPPIPPGMNTNDLHEPMSLAAAGYTHTGPATGALDGDAFPQSSRPDGLANEGAGGAESTGEDLSPRARDEAEITFAEQSEREPATGRGVATAAAENVAGEEAPRARRFPAIPDWDPPRLWPASRHGSDVDQQSSTGRFLIPPIMGGAEQAEENPSSPKPPVVEKSAASSAQASAPAPSLPFDPDAQVWEEELQKLISLLEADASVLRPGMSQSEQRDYIRRQIALRMLYLVANEPERAQQVIAGIPPAEQEFWTALFWGLSDYVDDEVTADPAERATLAIDQLRSAIHHLQTKARLDLQNLTFCRRINSFGSYEQFETDEFAPGETVLLYCEVRNFQTELSSSGEYQTRLKSSIEIYRDGAGGDLVDRNSFPATLDSSRTPRTDYFHSYRIDLPAHLSPGPYRLKLTVEDELSGKMASASIRLEIR